MPLLTERFRPPSLKEKSFNCPHCSALAKQFWHNLLAEPLAGDQIPVCFSPEEAEEFGKDIEDKETRASLTVWARKVAIGLPFIVEKRRDPYSYSIWNVSVSKCYNCNEIAVWIGNKLCWPPTGDVLSPNPDLSLDIRRDYEEAAAIVDASPRGAAALLRLAIQKVCVELGGAGRNLNEDIASLVSKGLDPRVQQALDVVRVVGNNAVHPGEIDLRDDRSTAERLFQLVNLIADIMISQPKHVAGMFDALPEGAREGIQRRDKATAKEASA